MERWGSKGNVGRKETERESERDRWRETQKQRETGANTKPVTASGLFWTELHGSGVERVIEIGGQEWC